MYKNYKKNYPYNEVSFVRNFKQMLEESQTVCEGRPAFKYKKGTDVVDVNKNTKEVELEASVNVDEGCTLEYYIVDATGASLRNSAPSEITGFKPFSIKALSASNLFLQWSINKTPSKWSNSC